MRLSHTVVAGLGNPLLRDDSAGLHLIDILESRLGGVHGVTCKKLYCGGIDLVGELASFANAIIVDCLVAPGATPGEIRKFDFSMKTGAEKAGASFGASHGVDLADALALGNALGFEMPGTVVVYGIVGGDVATFDTNPQSAVRSAVDRLAIMIERDVKYLASTRKI
jgi:hydrogenase maturation protease